MVALGGLIRKYRKQFGLKQSELACRINSSVSAISRYEKGWNRFEVLTLEKISKALSCDLIIDFKPKKKNSPPLHSVSHICKKLSRLFWDKKINGNLLKDCPHWVIQRVLDMGQLDDVKMIINFYKKDKFLKIINELHFTNKKTDLFWSQIIQQEGVPCTKKFSRKIAKEFWNI